MGKCNNKSSKKKPWRNKSEKKILNQISGSTGIPKKLLVGRTNNEFSFALNPGMPENYYSQRS